MAFFRGRRSKVGAKITGFLAGAVLFGCNAQQSASPPIPVPIAQAPAHPLPFKGRLAEGNRDDVPPAVAMSLSDDSRLVFIYREDLTHDEYHIPTVFSALDPVTYLGSPLGDYGVTASASLSIVDGKRVLGDYTAKAHVSKSYNLYREPTHRELEEAARIAVREKIDEKLYADAARVARAAAAPASSSAAAITE